MKHASAQFSLSSTQLGLEQHKSIDEYSLRRSDLQTRDTNNVLMLGWRP